MENARVVINKSLEVENLKINSNKVIQIGKSWNIYQVDYYSYFELKYYSLQFTAQQPVSPMKKIGKLKISQSYTGTKFDKMFESLQIPVILTPIFLHSYSQEGLQYAINIKGINSRQYTARIMDTLKNTLLSVKQENVNVRSFAIKSTYVPFKVVQCDRTTKKDTRLVITHDVRLKNVSKDDVDRIGSETILKKEKAVPLSMEEMGVFFSILQKCTGVNLKHELNNESKVEKII